MDWLHGEGNEIPINEPKFNNYYRIWKSFRIIKVKGQGLNKKNLSSRKQKTKLCVAYFLRLYNMSRWDKNTVTYDVNDFFMEITQLVSYFKRVSHEYVWLLRVAKSDFSKQNEQITVESVSN